LEVYEYDLYFKGQGTLQALFFPLTMAGKLIKTLMAGDVLHHHQSGCGTTG